MILTWVRNPSYSNPSTLPNRQFPQITTPMRTISQSSRTYPIYRNCNSPKLRMRFSIKYNKVTKRFLMPMANLWSQWQLIYRVWIWIVLTIIRRALVLRAIIDRVRHPFRWFLWNRRWLLVIPWMSRWLRKIYKTVFIIISLRLIIRRCSRTRFWIVLISSDRRLRKMIWGKLRSNLTQVKLKILSWTWEWKQTITHYQVPLAQEATWKS